MVELNVVGSLSHETVRRCRKKTRRTNRRAEYRVIPAEADVEFVAGMEEVLNVHERPREENHPVICTDE